MQYSAIIRTVGQNELLDKTLASLCIQTIPPTEILIVIPENCNTWHVSIPSVRFVHSEKGMVIQRKTGILESKIPYALLMDDDIVFNNNTAAERLIRTLCDQQAQSVIPYSEEAHPHGIIQKLVYSLFGIAVPTSKQHLGYTAGGGFYYPTKPPKEKHYTTEGGRGCMIAVDRNFLIDNNLFGDLDLQTGSYSLREDGAFISEIVTSGGISLMIGGVPYTHLGITRHLTSERMVQAWRTNILNNFLFWRRHIFPKYSKNKCTACYSILAFVWLLVGYVFMAIIFSLKKLKISPISGIITGFKDVIKIVCQKH